MPTTSTAIIAKGMFAYVLVLVPAELVAAFCSQMVLSESDIQDLMNQKYLVEKMQHSNGVEKSRAVIVVVPGYNPSMVSGFAISRVIVFGDCPSSVMYAGSLAMVFQVERVFSVIRHVKKPDVSDDNLFEALASSEPSQLTGIDTSVIFTPNYNLPQMSTGGNGKGNQKRKNNNRNKSAKHMARGATFAQARINQKANGKRNPGGNADAHHQVVDNTQDVSVEISAQITSPSGTQDIVKEEVKNETVVRNTQQSMLQC